MKDQYFFGRTQALEIDFFAFPRSGSHFFRYCTQGLFDLVALRTPGAGNEEAISRQEEVNPTALYALDLREDGVPHSPVVFHTRVSGQHGVPMRRDLRAIILVRNPLATIYSYYRAARDRWAMLREGTNHAAWVQAKFLAWHEFYREAFALLETDPDGVLLVRYETLRDSPDELSRLVRFVGVRPKLAPAFVFQIMRFEHFVRPGARTFYIAGDDDAWRSDTDFCELLANVESPDTTPMGYAMPTLHTAPEQTQS